VFENGVLRRIFGPKKEEEIGGWTKIAERGGCGGRHVERMGGDEDGLWVISRKTGGKATTRKTKM
jgi:hypothetical protein